ncbi:hypothetical protein [Ilumatobacter sp.]|uniref:hypothetical protein n=1 Tax=Ilumatobacter sp. TaxID=1967498 RepID=UPI0037531327
MAIIKSGVTTDELTVDPTSKAARVTLYNSDGTVRDLTVDVAVTVVPVTVAGNDIVAAVDVSKFSTMTLQITGVFTGATIVFEASMNNGDFDAIAVQDIGALSAPYVTSASTAGIYKVTTSFNWIRVRVTAIGTGTVDGTGGLSYKDSNTGQISATGDVTVSSGVALNAGAAVVGSIDDLAKLGGVAVSMGAGATDTGTQRVALANDAEVALAAGSNIIGSVLLAADPTPLITDFYTAAGGAVNVNSRSIRGQACVLRAIVMTNYAATARHVKIYDTAVAPVAGVGTPVIVLSMPAGGTLAYPLPFQGLAFSNGIGMTMVLGAANSDATPTATAPDISLTSIFT